MTSFNPSDCHRLFHGTLEPLKGILRPGGYDGLFWTAESSAVAQTYLPATGSALHAVVSRHELDQGVRPAKSNPFFTLAQAIGPAPLEVQWDGLGHAKSWLLPKSYATNRQVADHIETVLGYPNLSPSPASERRYELRTDGWNAQAEAFNIVSANFKKTGSLIIVTGHHSMRFFDMSLGESDLTDVQYHRHGAFAQARQQGYDGVVIDDFCQTKTWGNVAHRSIGFFDTALTRLDTTVIPATRFEWGEDKKSLSQKDSPEYAQWLRAQAAMQAACETRSLAPSPA